MNVGLCHRWSMVRLNQCRTLSVGPRRRRGTSSCRCHWLCGVEPKGRRSRPGAVECLACGGKRNPRFAHSHRVTKEAEVYVRRSDHSLGRPDTRGSSRTGVRSSAGSSCKAHLDSRVETRRNSQPLLKRARFLRRACRSTSFIPEVEGCRHPGPARPLVGCGRVPSRHRRSTFRRNQEPMSCLRDPGR